jgi:membrane protein YqaA with SNARE-associated domain
MSMESLLAQFTAWGGAVVKDWGYLGIFAISLVSSASIILPVPYFAFVFAAGAILNPFLVGIAGGLGSAIGEMTGYAVGFGGKKALNDKHEKLLGRAEKWVEKRGFFVVIIIFAATPLPDDVIGILAGALSYDVRKFFIACLIGKLALNLALAFGGFYGAAWLLGALGGG